MISIRSFQGAHDDTIRLWDLKTGRKLQLIQMKSAAPDSYMEGMAIFSIKFCGDDTKVVTPSGENCHVWNVERGQLLGQIKIPYRHIPYIGE